MKPYSFFSNCVFVHGYKNSVIMDLFRTRYKIIPNELAKLLLKFEGKNDFFIKDKISNEYNHFLNFLYQLEKEDYIYFSSKKIIRNWPKWNHEYHSSDIISQSILHITNFTNYDISNTISKIEKLGCSSLHIKVNRKLDFEELIEKITAATYNSSITIIEILYPFNYQLTNKLIDLLKTNKRFLNIYFKTIKNPELAKKILYVNIFENLTFSKKISQKDFIVNPILYNESRSFNTYYNKKIIVNNYGEFLL